MKNIQLVKLDAQPMVQIEAPHTNARHTKGKVKQENITVATYLLNRSGIAHVLCLLCT